MHPSKIQQSTSAKPDRRLAMGFRPIETDSKGAKQPSAAMTDTPSKTRTSNADQLNKISFDFNFASEDSELSQEAKKLMENIREEAAKIKSRMAVDQKEQKRKGEIDNQAAARKIAKPKGIASRFDEAHMAQFKKMDSIAGHPSAFRTRRDPVQASPVKTLKRTMSKARLDEGEKTDTPRSKSAATATATLKTPKTAIAKRRKNLERDDVSTRKPLSKDTQIENKPRPVPTQPGISKFETPQKSTLDYPNLKHPHTTKIPAMPRSPSHKSLPPPRTPQTDIKNNSKIPTFGLGGLKSILRRRQPLFSDDPAKIAAGTHISRPQADFESKLLGLPDSPNPNNATPSAKKRVDFSSSTKLRDACNELSPSASKTPVLETSNGGDVVYPSLPSMDSPCNEQEEQRHADFSFKIVSPTIRKITANNESSARRATVARHSPIQHGIKNKKRHREESEGEEPKTPTAQEGRVVKKVKPNPSTPVPKTPSSIRRRLPLTTPRRGATPAGSARGNRGSLTVSRLNLLSQPRIRR